MISIDTLRNEKANCMLCGSDIIHSCETSIAKCHYCGVEEETYIMCKNGHYVCNTCHCRDALKVIENICLNTELQNPIVLAEKIMEHPGVHMHGPEHHSLVPAVLVTTFRNYSGKKKEADILEAIKRGSNVPGGFCGIYGACGAGIGVGIAVCILTEATPYTPVERSHANWATSEALRCIADAGGARCCKKATRVSLEEGVAYLSNIFGLNWYEELNMTVKCNYTKHNKECDLNCGYREI
ncbi:DUF5714 domain-containing protein [Methanolobus sp. WCC5]|uniref:DUF5714 domain-containing protein n=1 Tax=Methanolobus sp. WCC5 TaxID=3125785 RepID=UPI0032456381